jgi:hypothetical protein
MGDLPKGWKTVALGDILTPEQITKTLEIINRPVSEIDKTRMLREYYAQFKAELSQKGYSPDYLAYAVPHFIQQHIEAQKKSQEAEAHDIMREFMKNSRN